MNECVIYNSFEDNELNLANSAFLYGESVFTSSLTTNGKWIFKNEHFQRLQKSSHFLFKFNDSKFFADLDTKVTELLKVYPSLNYLRITLFKDHLKKMNFSILLEKRLIPDSPLSLEIKICKQALGFPNFVKTGNYAYRFKEKNDSLELGFDDVLFIDSNQDILELSTSNIFLMMKDKSIITPALTGNIMDGIVRKKFIEFLKVKKFKVTEQVVKIEALENVISAVATNCVSQIRNINKIDNQSLEIGHFEEIKNDFLKGVGIHG